MAQRAKAAALREIPEAGACIIGPPVLNESCKINRTTTGAPVEFGRLTTYGSCVREAARMEILSFFSGCLFD
jgi:hypothetical protein